MAEHFRHVRVHNPCTIVPLSDPKAANMPTYRRDAGGKRYLCTCTYVDDRYRDINNVPWLTDPCAWIPPPAPSPPLRRKDSPGPEPGRKRKKKRRAPGDIKPIPPEVSPIEKHVHFDDHPYTRDSSNGVLNACVSEQYFRSHGSSINRSEAAHRTQEYQIKHHNNGHDLAYASLNSSSVHSSFARSRSHRRDVKRNLKHEQESSSLYESDMVKQVSHASSPSTLPSIFNLASSTPLSRPRRSGENSEKSISKSIGGAARYPCQEFRDESADGEEIPLFRVRSRRTRWRKRRYSREKAQLVHNERQSTQCSGGKQERTDWSLLSKLALLCHRMPS